MRRLNSRKHGQAMPPKLLMLMGQQALEAELAARAAQPETAQS
jgi:hypothetical protein